MLYPGQLAWEILNGKVLLLIFCVDIFYILFLYFRDFAQ